MAISKLLFSPLLPRKWDNLGTSQTPAEGLRPSALPIFTLAINLPLGGSLRVYRGKVIGLQRVPARSFLQKVDWLFVGAPG